LVYVAASADGGSRFRAMAHLSDDEAVAKMGHPSFCGLDLGHPRNGDFVVSSFLLKFCEMVIQLLRGRELS